MKQMPQKERYKTLKMLYERYKDAFKVFNIKGTGQCLYNIKTDDLLCIMQEIETIPISWKFYQSQDVKFSDDFEDLIIFHHE